MSLFGVINYSYSTTVVHTLCSKLVTSMVPGRCALLLIARRQILLLAFLITYNQSLLRRMATHSNIQYKLQNIQIK